MRRFIAAIATVFAAAALLAACGGSPSSSSSAPSSASQGGTSFSAPPSSSASSPSTRPGSGAAAGEYDAATLLATVAEAADLGATVPLEELDLKAGGIDMELVAAFAGAQSQNVAQNGGIAIVIQAAPGQAAAVAAQLEAYKQSSIGNPDYTEFEDARANTEGARVMVSGDYVVYAVSATAHESGWDKLDAALAALFV